MNGKFYKKSCDEVIETLDPILSEIASLDYEVKNCVRGAYTNCKTSNELGDYINNLADELASAANEVKSVRSYDFDEFDDEFDDSLEEDKIADKIKANQDTKEMTRRAINVLKDAGGEYKDLEQEFKDTYEEPIDESFRAPNGLLQVQSWEPKVDPMRNKQDGNQMDPFEENIDLSRVDDEF